MKMFDRWYLFGAFVLVLVGQARPVKSAYIVDESNSKETIRDPNTYICI